MNSLILKTTTKLLTTLLLMFSLYLLLVGHNEPGGGFVGGLVAAGAVALYAMAYDRQAAWRMMRLHPRTMIGIGLMSAVLSGLPSLLQGKAFMVSGWFHLYVPGLGDVALGTPLLFDAGVYLVVVGVTLNIMLTLAEE